MLDGVAVWLRRCVWAGLCAVALWPAAWAGVVPEAFEITRTEEAIEARARVALQLSEPVEAALMKGVPLHFVWQADVTRERWYWRDKRVLTSYRTWRLAYQPLTRRWRLSLSGQAPGAGQQFVLHQNVAQLDDALSAIGRLSAWAVAPSTLVSADDEHRVDLSFRLDASLLPRPFQIGVGSTTDWSVRWQASLPVPSKVGPSLRAPDLAEPDVRAAE